MSKDILDVARTLCDTAAPYEREWGRAAEEIERLRAENEALRKDAERYRWLRRDDLPYEKCAHLYDTHSNEELDAAIDAAMEKQ